MANTSIYNAFERLWQHIIAKLGNYATVENFDVHVSDTSNPHEVTKDQVGLGNVENKSSADIRGELTKENVTTALGYTPPTQNTTYNAATSSTLGLVKSGTDITVDANGNVSVKDDSHNHVISNVDGLQSILDAKADDEELPIYLTQAEYDALPDTKFTDDKLYMITDADDFGGGSETEFDNLVSKVNNLEQSFQDGCDSIADECTASGATPSAKTPTGIVAAIKKIFTDRYNKGVSDTKKGTAAAGDVLAGKTFTNSSTVGATGTMINRNIVDSTLGGINSSYPSTAIHKGTNPQIGTTVTSAEKLFALRPPAGYYNGSYVGILQSELASKIGLTAAKILSGNTILGIAGTGGQCKQFERTVSASSNQTFSCGFAPYAFFIQGYATTNKSYAFYGRYIGASSGTMRITSSRGSSYNQDVTVTISGNNITVTMPNSNTIVYDDGIYVTVMSKNYYDAKSS